MAKSLRACLLSLCCATASAADAPQPDVAWHGLADLRYTHSDAADGGLQQGLGKFRDGGDSGRLRVNEIILTLQARLDWDWTATATLKYADRQHIPVDLTEAFLSYRPVSTRAWRLGGCLGVFLPPVSLENSGIGWSSPYTLASSAINAWAGEELRVFGGEGQLTRQFDNGDRLTAFAAGFANNDTAGALLAWRGFSLHDYEATLFDRLPLPTGVGVQRHFPQQAALTQPFVEVDGRPGYYLGLSFERQGLGKLRGLYYDNRGRPDALENGQYSWHTRFASVGAKLELAPDFDLIAQGLSGQTRMGEQLGGRRAVAVSFWSWSLLLSKRIGEHRASLRYERFGSDENDFLPQDRNRENGAAFTAHYHYTFAKQHQLGVEFHYIDSHRPARLDLNQPTPQTETQTQVFYRLFF